MNQRLKVNDKYIPLLTNQSRRLVLYGGSGSGKSVFAAQKIALRTLTELGHKFLCLRKVGETVKLSIFAELKEAIESLGCLEEFSINQTEKVFTHKVSGNQIICKGLDEPEKIKSIKGITGVWVEEATEFNSKEIDQLDLRVRGIKKNYVQYIYSFNPISEDNEIVKRFVTEKVDSDCLVVHSTHEDNYFLSEDDRKVLYELKDRNPLFYDVYCLGKPGVVDKSNKFLYSFNTEKQIVEGLTINDSLPIWLTFDFNIDPMTVTIGQRINNNLLHCIKSIQLDNSDIYQMLDRIESDYPGKLFIVTGDASGHNRIGAVRGKTSYWLIIKKELNLKESNIYVRKQNIGLIDSRVLCNAVNQSVRILFDKQGCEPLINDCKFAKVDDRGELIKDRKKQKNDFLDGFRYLVDANFHDFLRKPKKYR